MLRLLASLALAARIRRSARRPGRAESRRPRTEAKPAAAHDQPQYGRRPRSSRNFPASARRSPPESSSTARRTDPFKKVEELMNVQGIGEKSFLQFRSQLTVGQ